MPAVLTDIDTLQEYISGVIRRAEHHANNVDEICLTVAGAVIAHKDRGTNLEVRQYGGRMANVLWAWINGTRYAITYNHEDESIDVKEATLQGRAVCSFTNANTADQVKRAFARL